ncbi:hypothetical protein [Thioclava indica]|uniref:hypothetical protein n=1 Tax=Thioclava indica TaxID=1353528 RepID=UPI0012DC048F|nr:hypothetical protein [Thioclava indica]
MLKSREDAFNLLERLGAPQRLFKHLQLVGEVGGEIISKLDDLGVQYDKRCVQVGIAVHDAGIIVHPNELEGGGNLHEAAGEKLLLE